MRRSGLGARLRYEFDKTMAAGPIALIGWLALVSLLIIAVAGFFLALTNIAPEGGAPMSVVEGIWASLMRTLDAGTMGADTGWPFRFVMLAVTLAGIFIVSALIGVLSAGVETKLDELRKGRSVVLEKNHTIILNWSPSIFDIISELVIANSSSKRPCIVVMADKDKVEMEDEIASKIGNTGNTRVICRRGDPTDLHDLEIVNPATCKSVIVLSPESDDPDSQVVKSILALVNDPKRRAERYMIAAEIREAKNAEIARVVGGKEVQLVLADELISRIVVHSTRQSGLSAVYSELLDFDGCEIYVVEQPQIAGMTFGAALSAYDSCTLLGLCDPQGNITLNPPMNAVIPNGARAILIAEDDDAIRFSATSSPIDVDRVRDIRPETREADRTLILGWNRRGPIITYELSRTVAPGSVLTIAADTPDLQEEMSKVFIAGDALSVDLKIVDTGRRIELDALDIPSYDHVLVLGYSDTMAPQPADTRSLVTLLHLRKIADEAGRHISVISEMIDVRNRELAEVTRADDFVVSNKLVSLMLAQASENEHLSAIFDQLLDVDGSEIYIRPITDYVAIDRPVSFHTVVDAARRRGEVAIGHRLMGVVQPDERNLGGVVVNPTKSTVVNYGPADKVIVLARE